MADLWSDIEMCSGADCYRSRASHDLVDGLCPACQVDAALAATLRCEGCSAPLAAETDSGCCAECDARALYRTRAALLVLLARAAAIAATGPRRCLTVEGVEVRGAA